MGLTLSEYGLENRRTGEKVACSLTTVLIVSLRNWHGSVDAVEVAANSEKDIFRTLA